MSPISKKPESSFAIGDYNEYEDKQNAFDNVGTEIINPLTIMEKFMSFKLDIPETPLYKSKPMISKEYKKETEVKVGNIFNNKEDLVLAIRLKALDEGYQFLSDRSTLERCGTLKGSIQGNKSGSCGHGWKQPDCANCFWYMQRRNRHAAIALAVHNEFPLAFHAAYTPKEFSTERCNLQDVHPDAYHKLIQVGPHRWSRAHCPLVRYNYMTSNSVESVNACIVLYRKLPVLKLAETYRAMVQEWYFKHQELTDNMRFEITDWVANKVNKKMMKSATWLIYGVNHYQYQVLDGRYNREVDFQTRTCQCRKWQQSGIPCGHVIVVTRYDGRSTYYGGIAPCTHQWVMTEAMCDSTILSGISAPLSITSHNMMTSNQSSGLEIDNPHDHIRGYPLFYSHLEDLVSKFINEFFPPSRTTNLRNEIFNFQQRFDESFHEAWDRYKDLIHACPHHGFTELHQLDTFYNALNPADQDSLNSAAGGNLLERHTQDVLTIIKNKSKPNLSCRGGERVEETLTDPELAEYTIKVPPPLVQKAKPTSLKNYVVHKRDPLHPNIPYPSRMHQEKQQEKDGLPELISTQMTLELANRDICTPVGIARDVFVPVGKFTFPADFVIVDYESDPRVPLILGRPFLRTARALIDVHGEEMILRDGNERLILNMRHDTSSYSNEPHQESINMIDVYNVSHEEYREDLFATNHPSGNPTSSLTSHTDLTSPEVINPSSGNPTPISEPETKSSSSSPTLTSIEESDLIWEEFEAYLASDSFPPGNSNPSSPLPPFHNSLSGSTTSSSPSLPISETSDYFLEEFADELALITFPPGNDDLPFDAESDLREIEYLLNHDPIKEMDSILEDSVDENSPNDNLVDTISEMFTDEHALDYSSPPLWDDYDDNLFDLRPLMMILMMIHLTSRKRKSKILKS
ncbi:reverse transcriptase domain-containing protein [Tanacetum coccineum]